MDAKRLIHCAAIALALTGSAWGAQYRTANFVVNAPTDDMAQRIAKCAEHWREELALNWLGQKLPNWSRPCPIEAKVGQMGAGGQTTFTFDGGEVFGWRMEVQGTLERVLDSVIPHEVNHTIFASHFRRPLPRWADEGAATLFEHASERDRQLRTLHATMKANRRIPLQQLLGMREYPRDQRDVLTLYAEGYSLASFLVGKKGEQGLRTYLAFLTDAHTQGWEQAIQRHYGFTSVAELEKEWTDWFLAGSPSMLPEGRQLAAAEVAVPDAPPATNDAEQPAAQPESQPVARAQSPEADAALPPLQPINRALRPGGALSELDVAPQRKLNPNSPPAGARDGLIDLSRNLRPRVGVDPTLSPSLPPASLSPTADGMNTNIRSKSYGFPAARR